MCTRLKHIPFKSIGLVLAGATILSFGTFNFNYQNNITEGGVLGLLLLFKNLFDISPSLTNIILDFSLFLLGARFFGKRFLLYSLFSTVTFSTTYGIWESIGPLAPNLSEHMLTASLLAGLFVGVGVGLVVLGGGASGGDDVIALLGSKFTPLKLNWVYMITDFTVLILSLSYLGFEQIFWSLIAVTVSGNVISLIHAKGEASSDSDLDIDQTSDIIEEFSTLNSSLHLDSHQTEITLTPKPIIQQSEEC